MDAIVILFLIGINFSMVLLVAGWRLACLTQPRPTPQPDVIYILSEEGAIIEEADGRWQNG